MTKENDNRYVLINGATLCFEDYGDSDVPILFIHGFPFDKSCWDLQSAFLKNHYRVIQYDVRGFGNSEAGEQTSSMTLLADDLVLFMDQLGIEKAIVCGISMGGYILMNAVSRFPDRFKALILCDTQCIGDTPEAKIKREENIHLIESGKLEEYADQFIGKVFSPGTYKSNISLVSRIKNIITSTKTSSITGGLKALKERDEMCSRIPSIDIPVLILCGEEDVITPVRQSELLHKQIGQSELYLIPGAGHLSNLEQPQLFNARIDQFLSKVFE